MHGDCTEPSCFAPNTNGAATLSVPDQVTGTPTIIGVPSYGKAQDLRRAFSYQYSVASAWWQQWYQWYARNYTGTPFEPLAAVPVPVQQGALAPIAAHAPNHAAADADGMDWTEAQVTGGQSEGGGPAQPRTGRSDTSKVCVPMKWISFKFLGIWLQLYLFTCSRRH
jgi:hypothetical protein